MALTFVKASGIDITGNYTVNGMNVSANLNSGNANLGNAVTANYFIGNGSLLTGLPAGYTDSNVASYLPTFTGNIKAGNANLGNLTTSNYFSGSGNLLSNIQGANVSGAVSYATTANSVAGANVSGAVSYATTANSVAGANVSGAVSYATTANSVAVANVSGIGNIATLNLDGNASNILYGNGSFASAPVTYGNSNVASFLASYGSNTIVTTGNVSVGNIIGNGQSLTGINGSNVTGQVANATVAGTVYTNAQPNITSVGTLTSLSVTGNVGSGNANLGNLATSNYFSGSGNLLSNIQGANVSGAVSYATTANSVAGANVSGQVGNALIAGTVYTNAQPNITSVGTLTSLSVTNDVVVGGNLTVNGTTTSINSTVVQIDDLAIVLANDASTTAQANGAGIIINGASANMLYINSTNSFTFSHKISADGGLLSNITGSNITGAVAYATTANSVAGANVSGEVSYAATANSVAGANVTGQVSNALVAGTVYTNAQPNITSVGTLTSLSVTGNISSGNANLGNLATANFFTGNGSLLTSLTGANVTGFVPNANVSNTAYAVAGANVTGQVANALVAGTVYTAAQPNITSVGTLTSFTSNGTVSFVDASNVSLGDVSNIHISGGTADYVLQTDGAGNLSWVAQSVGSTTSTTIAVDNFTGNGVADTYTLSVTPTSVNSVFVNYNGAFVGRASYSLSGANLTFGSVPANGASIEVTTIDGLSIGSGAFTTRTATGDGSETNYTVTSGVTVSSVLVTIDGVLQTPTTDYTVSGTTLTFTTAPYDGAAIQIRNLAVASSPSSGSALLIQDEGTNLVATANTINFVGSGVTATNTSNVVTVTIEGASPGGSNTQVQFYDGSGFGGNAGLTFNKTSTTLTANNFVATTTANLGSNANVTITGGTSGQVLSTNGSGELSWATVSSGPSNVSIRAQAMTMGIIFGG